MNHVIRIAPGWIRKPLVLVFFPLDFAQVCLAALWHSPRRLLEGDFYDLAWALFWCAWDGVFVP